MHSLRQDIRSLDGLAATHELLARGHSKARLRHEVAHSRIVRVRKGWYVLPETDDVRQQAARVGGRLTCASAAIAMGLWVPSGSNELHVAVRPSACQLRSQNDYRRRITGLSSHGVVVHWNDSPDRGSRLVQSPIDVLEQICVCRSDEFAFVVCESALHKKRVTPRALASMACSLSRRKAAAISGATGLSESGTESMFSFRMRRLGVTFRQQVKLGGDRVDFVLGDRLVVEIDSKEFHDALDDRQRDARLSILGFRVLRFMYSQVVDEWGSVRDSVFAALARGDHQAR